RFPPARSEQSEHHWNKNDRDANALQEQVAAERADHSDPIMRSGDRRIWSSGVERRVERRIGNECEEKEGREDEQDESNQLIQAPDLRGRKNQIEIRHRGVTVPLGSGCQGSRNTRAGQLCQKTRKKQ